MKQVSFGPSTAPSIEARPMVRWVHGTALEDDYAWLRAENWRDVLRDPGELPGAIRDVLERENELVEAALAPTSALRKTLVKEMRGRMEEEDAEVPVPDGPFEYYGRYREGGQHELACRVPRGGGAESVLLDGDALAKNKPFFDLGTAQHSPDHGLLAWSADEKGSELYTIRVRDLATGRDLPDLVPETDGEAVWASDNASFFYARVDADHRARSVWRHTLGTDGAADALVYDEPDPTWFVSVGRTRSGRYGVISIHGHDASEIRVLDLASDDPTPRLIEPRRGGLRYELDHHRDRFLLLTNSDDAVDFKIVDTPVDTPGRAFWRDVVPHRAGCMIVGFACFERHLVRLEREDGLPRIAIRDFATADERTVAFSEEAYSLGLEHVAEQATTVMRFSYSSMTTPEEVYDFDMAADTRTLRKRQRVPSGHDPEDYVARRILATAPDGAKVPISLLYRKGVALDGTAPLLLYAYGAYGHALSASFGTKRLSLVDRGFVFALAHVRGGTDKGWAWYTDGKLANKQHTFDDYVAVARALIEARYTAPGRIVAQGGSAGGMVMGAAANAAPELFAGMIADVPFVDVLNTMLDDQLPLTPPEWLEWGNPIADETAFRVIRSYSPYDNVSALPYPPILALGGLTDPRVTYWEPAKWVAKLRASTTGTGPILLKTNMDAGHGGASGRFDQLDEVALQYAFALAVVGRSGEAPAGQA